MSDKREFLVRDRWGNPIVVTQDGPDDFRLNVQESYQSAHVSLRKYQLRALRNILFEVLGEQVPRDDRIDAAAKKLFEAYTSAGSLEENECRPWEDTDHKTRAKWTAAAQVWMQEGGV